MIHFVNIMEEKQEMKKIALFIMICVQLFIMSVPCYATEPSVTSPATGDVTSVVALALVGVAAIGGFLLKKAK